MFRICQAVEVDQEALGRFLHRSFAPSKADFVLRHGTWKHRGEDNQMVLVEGDRVVGYCGVIPTSCRLDSELRDAVWWVDLVIAPSHRGRGLQTLFDERVRQMTQLKLGFPNALAAKIHRKHGWGVREDYETLLLPLRPRLLPKLQRASGAHRLALQTAALLIEPAAAFVRRSLERHDGKEVERSRTLDTNALAGIFEHCHPRDQTTTRRDSAYLEWRYDRSPDRGEITVYLAGGCLAAIVRILGGCSPPAFRILDIFGALHRQELLIDLLRSIGRDAVRAGATQTTLLSTLPTISRAARQAEFRVPGDGRFCWYSDDPLIHQAVADSSHHWVLGDSDHDEPL